VAILSINWKDNEEGTGFKYVPPIPVSGATVSYSVLSVSKYVGGKYTTAIVDYSIENNVITIYSDEKFDGKLAYSYKVE
jgi:hypothetical protein